MLPITEKIDPRVIRTRKLLLDAFLCLLAEKRFDEISVQDITARATVNRATFYAHFVDKYALVNELIGCGFAQVLQRHMATPASTAQEHLRRLLLAVTDHRTEVHGQCQQRYPMFESLAEAQVKQQLRDNVHDWLREHHATQSCSAEQLELAATIVSWSLYGAGVEWSKRVGAQSAEAFADAALPLITATVMALGEA